MRLPATSDRLGRTLERDWPEHDFGLIEEIWWPQEEEPEASIIDRAARFRE